MISFDIGRTRVSIGFSFLLFNAIIFLFSSESLLMQFYAACALHEMGHILAACSVGVRIKSVVFSGGGIRMLTDRGSVVTNCENVLMLLSGPAVNLFLAAALSIHGAVGDFAMLNLAAGLYNLLPFRQLDGGALVDIFITGTVHEREWRGVLLAVRRIIVLAGTAVFCLWA